MAGGDTVPSKPMRPCSYPGCRTLTRERHCDKHKKQEQKRVDQQRGTAVKRGYNSRWQKARLTYLKSHPLCVECLKEDKVVAATVVDHIIPHKGDQKLFWDTGNWQALCKQCHDKKTAREDGGFGRG